MWAYAGIYRILCWYRTHIRQHASPFYTVSCTARRHFGYYISIYGQRDAKTATTVRHFVPPNWTIEQQGTGRQMGTASSRRSPPTEPMACSHPPAVLSIDGCPDIELPVLTDAFGNKFVDIQKMYAQHKVCTFDPGFMSTASCTSKITYIDGDAGILLYRGYPIEQLVESADFYDVAFLLLHGELPNAVEKKSFRKEITYHTMVHEKIATMLPSFNYDSDPMNVLCGAVAALAAFYPESANVKDPSMQILACHRLIAKMPTIAAMIHKILLKGQPTVYPKNDLSIAENFLYMMHSMPTEPYEIDPVKSKALETSSFCPRPRALFARLRSPSPVFAPRTRRLSPALRASLVRQFLYCTWTTSRMPARVR